MLIDMPIHDGCKTSPVPSSSSLATLALFLKSFLFCWSIALLAWVASSEAQFPMAAVAGAAAGTEVRGHWSGHVWGVNVLRHSSEYDLVRS